MIELVSVASGNSSARIRLGATTFTVTPLATFGGRYRLLNLRDNSCAAVQAGGTVFDLCEGRSKTIG